MSNITTIQDLPNIYAMPQRVNDLLTEYKEDLKTYVEKQGSLELNPDLQEFWRRYILNKLEEKWVPLLGFNKNQIQRDIQDLSTPKVDIKNSLSLREVLSLYKPGSSWIIPNLLRTTGLYLLASEPKVGKTILVNFLMHSIVVSKEFLGLPARPGKVLYIQLEESIDTMAERFMLTGFGDVLDEETSLVVNFVDRVRIERRFDITTDIDWLIRTIQDYQPTVVIIDSLRMSQLKSAASENSNEYGKAVYMLQNVFNYTGTCGIVIHHMSKRNGRDASKTSLVELLAGHTSISAASDGLIGLMSSETAGGRVISLKTLPRQGAPISISYRIRTRDGLWRLEKLSEDTPAKSDYTGRILRHLANHLDEYYSARQIAAAIDCDPAGIDFCQAISYLESSQIIVGRYHNKRFLYALTADSSWVVNPASVKDLVSPNVLDANNLMRCRTKRELRELVTQWTPERQREAKRLLLREERERIGELIQSWEFLIGEVVMYQGQQWEVTGRVQEEASLRSNSYYLQGLDSPVLETDLEVCEDEIIPDDVQTISVEAVAIIEEDVDDDDDDDLDEFDFEFGLSTW